MSTACGSPLYMAPEVILNKDYNEKADVFSIGVMAWQLITGGYPWDVKTKDELKMKVKNREPEFDAFKNIFNGVSKDCHDFLSKALIKDFNQRPSAGELLNHKWITDNKAKYEINKIRPDRAETGNILSHVKQFA